MSIPFTFPNYRQNFEAFQNIQSIKRELQKQCDAFTLWNCNFKIQKRNNGKYIYAKCKSCNASLRFIWVEGDEVYRLSHFNNQHRHEYSANVDLELRKFIEDLPLSVQLATARKIATSKFKISASKFYHTYSKLKKSTSTISELIKQLERRDYDISLDPYPLPTGQLPQITIIISPQMKQNFRLYGQVVCYDLTYSLVQQSSPQKRPYAVGIFTGVNCYNKIIPFAITITCQETTQAFCKIFQTFIQSAGSPRSFITDEQSSIIAALKRLQQNEVFNGTHLIDSFHVIRNFGKISEKREFAKEISELIKEENPFVFEIKLKELKQKLFQQKQLKAYQLFYAKRQQVCFSQIPRKSFLIFNASNSINQKMNDLIKIRIRSQKKYSQVLRLLVQFCQNLSQTSQESIEIYDYRIQQIFQDPQLKLCRYLLASRPMKEFLLQYVASLSLKEPHRQGYIYVFEEQFATFQCQYTDHFDCSCNYTAKTGIGCRHMIWICRRQKLQYLTSVHQRWKFEKKQGVRIIKRSNRSTRRRR